MQTLWRGTLLNHISIVQHKRKCTRAKSLFGFKRSHHLGGSWCFSMAGQLQSNWGSEEHGDNRWFTPVLCSVILIYFAGVVQNNPWIVFISSLIPSIYTTIKDDEQHPLKPPKNRPAPFINSKYTKPGRAHFIVHSTELYFKTELPWMGGCLW